MSDTAAAARSTPSPAPAPSDAGADASAGPGLPPASLPRPALRVTEDGEASAWSREEVVTEYPLTLLVNGRELATIVCSPTHLEELVLGFLTAEGVLRRGEPIDDLYVIPEEGIAVVDAPEREGAAEAAEFGRRYVGSCCGKGRTGFYLSNDARTARRVESDLSLGAADCFRLMADLQAASPLFAETGGVHNAALGTPAGLEAVRMDIGRHNTLDKLYGRALRHATPLGRRVVAFSGRISSEIVLKVAKMGCPVLLSKSAPTTLALALAEELGVTTVGFLRGGRMTVYTGRRRLVDLPRAEGGPGPA